MRTTSALAEDLREAVGDFVRAMRDEAGTPSNAQSETLGLLDREGPMSVAELAQCRKVKHQSMRLVVGQLEAEGRIARASDWRDRRSQTITITAAGRAVLRASRTERTRAIETALAILSDEEQQILQAAAQLLKRIAVAQAG